MTTHDNYAMVLIRHNQTSPTLGRTLIYLFLLHIVAQNAFHSLIFAKTHNNIKIIKFKKPPHTC